MISTKVKSDSLCTFLASMNWRQYWRSVNNGNKTDTSKLEAIEFFKIVGCIKSFLKHLAFSWDILNAHTIQK